MHPSQSPLHQRVCGQIVILSNLEQLMNDPRYPSARDQVLAWLQENYRSFVLELRDVRSAGAPFVGLLLTLTRLIRGQRGEIVLAHPSPSVRAMLRDMRLEDHWDVFPSVQDALRFFAPPPSTLPAGPPPEADHPSIDPKH